MRDSSDAEFYADFGDGLSAAEVEAVLERARASGDREVRLLAKQYLALRQAALALADACGAGGGGPGDAARLVRFLAG